MSDHSPRYWLRLYLTSIPVALTGTVSWFGVYTFVNGFVIVGLGGDNTMWTRLTLCFLGALIVWNIAAPSFVKWFGRRGTVVLGMSASAVGFLGMAFADQFIEVGILLALISLAMVGQQVAWLSLVSDYGGDEPGKAIAIVKIVMAATAALTLAAGGWFTEQDTYDWLFIAIAGSLCVGIVWFWIGSRAMESGAPRSVKGFMQISGLEWRQLLTGTAGALVVFGFLCEAFNALTVNQLFPNLGRDVHAMNESSIAVVVGFGQLAALVTLFLLLKRVDRLNAAKVYGAAVAATGLIVITMGSVGGSTAAATCFAVYYLGYGVIWATNSAALNAAVDRNLRESAFALAGMAATVGTFAVGIVHWQMLEFHISLPDVYRICGLIATLAGVVLFVVGRKR